MQADDFLDDQKRRYFRLNFPDFFIDSENSFLLDVKFHEVISESPDIEIGNLTIPELYLQTGYADLKTLAGCEIQAESGIEQSREDVTEAVLIIQEYFSDSGNELLLLRTVTGVWLAVQGNKIYSVRIINHQADVVYTYAFTSNREITGIWLEENDVQINSQNQIISSIGKAYLLHSHEPYLTCAVFQTDGLSGQKPYLHFDEQEYAPNLPEELIRKILQSGDLTGTDHIGYGYAGYSTPFESHVQKLYLRSVRNYDDSQVLRKNILSGEILDFEMKSYGKYTLKEISTQDEETLDLYCYGILDKLENLSAEPFFTRTSFFHADYFSDLYQNFIAWLNQNGIEIQTAEQEFLNLGTLPLMEPDWNTADFSGITAAQVLKEFAILEAGNARLNHDNLLELGRNYAAPVLTVTAEVLESVRLGTEKPAAAQGLEILNQDVRNLIRTSLKREDLCLESLTDQENFLQACSKIIHKFYDDFYLPFSASVLVGASPFLRAGDCIRIVSKNRISVTVPVIMQELTEFPFLKSRVSLSDGTSWETVPVNFSGMVVNGIAAENWPSNVLVGEVPDFSDMIITALRADGQNFQVNTRLCEFEITMKTETYAFFTVCFAGVSSGTYSNLLYALRTASGEKLLTTDGHPLASKESN
ncbi:MAG: hypothetical protein IJ642_09705 [Oscillospiraceae bacterium]|nr:hypothetical protein [Oscillospiraceae bacterium]